jgi:hypothetical protein
MLSKIRTRSWAGRTAVVVAAGTLVSIAAIAPALANAPNPNPDIKAVETVNPNGTVTVKVSGTWSWPGQSCEGRYGEGWAVDWWGISASPTPANAFTLTNASIVTAPGTTTTGDEPFAGSIQLPNNGGYFHVGEYYDGEDVNSSSTCTDTGTGGSAGSTGSWSATATYPNKSDLPPQICVNMYDEHGSEGKPSGSANDFSPTKDNDNSIQTNAFNPTAGAGYCAVPTIHKVPKPGITLVKQICNVAASKCSKSSTTQWVSNHEVASGSPAVWKITVTDSGNTNLTGITITDALAPACAGTTTPSSLKAGGTVVVTCQTPDVTKGFTNVAKVTGAPPSGASVTATGSATVTVKKPKKPSITTSQSITPNDEGFLAEGATGSMTFSLYPPSNASCSGTPAFTQTVTMPSGGSGTAETTNTTFIATQPGTWRWLVTYTGNDGSATSPCGSESFTIKN